MSDRAPPALALWLLERCGSASYAESLAGDLIEEYRQGRSRGWLWRQVAMALGVALQRFIRTMPWIIVLRASLRMAAETAAVLAIVTVVEQSRRNSVGGDAANFGFIGTVAALITVASLAIVALMGTQSMATRRQRPAEALAGVLMLAFGVIALGMGTFTRADTTRSGADTACGGADAVRSCVDTTCSRADATCRGPDDSSGGAARRADCNCR